MAERSDRSAERVTPYGLVFDHEVFEARYFPAIATEARERGGDPRSFETFVGLEEVTELLGRLLPDSESGGVESAAALARHAKLLYQAFHYWQARGRAYAGTPELVRRLLSPEYRYDAPETLPLPGLAGYAQLPANLLWASVADDAAPEPVDGFFWTRGEQPFTGEERLEIVYVLGVRPGRPGFSMIDLGALLLPGAPQEWERSRGRAEGVDFANVLPGGELDRLHSLVTHAEALKLVGRWFGYIAAEPAALVEQAGVIRVRLVNG